MAFEMIDGDEGLSSGPARSPCRWSIRPSTRRSGPGRQAAATASMSPQGASPPPPAPAGSDGRDASTCARAAISGTTPPYAACSAIWLKHGVRGENPLRPPFASASTTAAAVSSQVAFDAEHAARLACIPDLPRFAVSKNMPKCVQSLTTSVGDSFPYSRAPEQKENRKCTNLEFRFDRPAENRDARQPPRAGASP